MVQFNTQCVLLVTISDLKLCNFVYSEQIAHQDIVCYALCIFGMQKFKNTFLFMVALKIE